MSVSPSTIMFISEFCSVTWVHFKGPPPTQVSTCDLSKMGMNGMRQANCSAGPLRGAVQRRWWWGPDINLLEWMSFYQGTIKPDSVDTVWLLADRSLWGWWVVGWWIILSVLVLEAERLRVLIPGLFLTLRASFLEFSEIVICKFGVEWEPHVRVKSTETVSPDVEVRQLWVLFQTANISCGFGQII